MPACPPCDHTSLCQFIWSNCTLSLCNSCYVFHVNCLLFKHGAQENNNVIKVCMQYQASSTAVNCEVGDASHLEWMKPLGDCLICLGPEVRIHLLHTYS